MSKNKVVTGLYKNDGWWVADIHWLGGSYHSTQRFLWYNKKDVISKLRHEHGCIVTGDVIKHGTDYKALY